MYPVNFKNFTTKKIAESLANVILGTIPPAISPSEISLPRIQRTTLAQLQYGHCKLLNVYKVLLKHTISALCTECLFRRQTVTHIFNCDAVPTPHSSYCTRSLDEPYFCLQLSSLSSLYLFSPLASRRIIPQPLLLHLGRLPSDRFSTRLRHLGRRRRRRRRRRN